VLGVGVPARQCQAMAGGVSIIILALNKGKSKL